MLANKISARPACIYIGGNPRRLARKGETSGVVRAVELQNQFAQCRRALVSSQSESLSTISAWKSVAGESARARAGGGRFNSRSAKSKARVKFPPAESPPTTRFVGSIPLASSQ